MSIKHACRRRLGKNFRVLPAAGFRRPPVTASTVGALAGAPQFWEKQTPVSITVQDGTNTQETTQTAKSFADFGVRQDIMMPRGGGPPSPSPSRS